MERREWWTDDLIEAVSCLVSVDIGDDCLVVADVYAIIAAVEDWQAQHARDKVVMVAGNPGTYVGGLEAAIQRVQAVCDRRDAEVADMDPFFRQVVEYSEHCNCQWCANLDAKPCVVIERLEKRIAVLERARTRCGYYLTSSVSATTTSVLDGGA